MNIRSVLRVGQIVVVLFGLLVEASLPAYAQSAGKWLFKIGYNEIRPAVSSGNLSAPSLPLTQADVGKAQGLIITAAYMHSDHLSSELFLGTPYTHDVFAAGILQGVGRIGTVQQLPPTYFVQYRFFEPDSAFRPYFGLGVSFAMFRNERSAKTLTALTNPGGVPTTFKVADAWGIGPQFGMNYRVTDRWFVDFSVAKSFIKTHATFSTGQRINLRLDPTIVNLSIGFVY